MAWATPSRLRVCVWEARSPGVGRARSGGGTLLLPRGPPRWREAAGPGCEGGSALCWCPAGFPRLWKVGLAHGLDPLSPSAGAGGWAPARGRAPVPVASDCRCHCEFLRGRFSGCALCRPFSGDAFSTRRPVPGSPPCSPEAVHPAVPRPRLPVHTGRDVSTALQGRDREGQGRGQPGPCCCRRQGLTASLRARLPWPRGPGRVPGVAPAWASGGTASRLGPRAEI